MKNRIKKRVALCFRGKCMDMVTNHKDGKTHFVDCIRFWKRIERTLIKPNQDLFDFDIYMHGWVGSSETKRVPEILEVMKPVDYVLEEQRDFSDDYVDMVDFSAILYNKFGNKEAGKTVSDYDDIHYRGFFDSLMSYAYSMSRSARFLQSSHEDYDLGVSIRFDVLPNGVVSLSEIDRDLFYLDKDARNLHSPVFFRDFFCISSAKKVAIFSEFYEFVKNNIFHDPDFAKWFSHQCSRVNEFPNGRLDTSMYGHQTIFSYFLWKNGVPVEKIRHTVSGSLLRGSPSMIQRMQMYFQDTKIALGL